MTLVTVISTCFNQQDLIGDAIRSVGGQKTRADVFHVVCDDGSTDGSWDVLCDWERCSCHLRALRVTNRGFPGALNAALLAVPHQTSYVVVLPGDDWLAPDFVEECLNAVEEHRDADVVITGMRRVGWPDRPDQVLMPTVRHPSLEQLWRWQQTYVWSCAFVRRSALLETGGFHPFTSGDCDWDMWIDLKSRGCRFAYTDKTHYCYRYNPRSLNRGKTKADWDEAREEMRRHHRRDTLPGPEFS